jgi:hypothetical protein
MDRSMIVPVAPHRVQSGIFAFCSIIFAVLLLSAGLVQAQAPVAPPRAFLQRPRQPPRPPPLRPSRNPPRGRRSPP